MATSGSKSIQLTNYDELWFHWQVTGTDTEKNTSTVFWWVQLVSGDYGAISSSVNKPLSVNIQGTTYNYDVSIAIPNNSSRTLCSGNHTAQHNLNGTCSFNYFVTITANITFGGEWVGVKQIQGTASLNRIDRRSTISCPNAYVEDEAVIYINSYDSSFTHTITYSFKGETGTIVTKTNDSVVYWQTPASFWELMPTETEAQCTLTCQTYSGSTLVGSSTTITTMLTGTLPPTFSATFTDTSGSNAELTGSMQRSIRYYTAELWYEITASPARGASISAYQVKYGNKTYTGQSGSITSSDYTTATITVTDSRGVSATETVALDMADYFYPTAVLRVGMPTTDGEVALDVSGKIFMQRFDNGTGGQMNSLDVSYRYKEEGGSYGNWISMNDSLAYTTEYYTAEATATGLDYTKSYTFQVMVADTISNRYSAEITVRSTPVFDWGAHDFAFNVPVSIQGNQVADFIVEQGTEAMGTNGTWYWSKWASGRAECYGLRNYGNMAVTTTWGNLYRSEIFTQSLPSGLFKNGAEYIGINLMTGGYGGWIAMHEQTQPSEYETGSFIVVRPASASITGCHISFYCVGRWK